MRIKNIILITACLIIGSINMSYAEGWKKGFFSDEFGEQSKSTFIQYTTDGTFSNSATVGSYCAVDLLVSDTDKIGLFIYEYSRKRSPVYFISGGGSVRFKNSNGDLYRTRKITKWSQSGGLTLQADQYDAYNIIQFLKKSSGEFKVVVYGPHSSVYHFKINADGFTAAYKNRYWN